MMSQGWKELVLARYSAALSDTTPGSPTSAKRYSILERTGGAVLGISTISIADAWRVAHLNMTSARKPEQGPGVTSFADLWK